MKYMTSKKCNKEVERLSNRKTYALVTGASQGIGRAIAIDLAANGCHVIINYNSNQDATNEAAQQIINANGSCSIMKADVSSESEVKEMFKWIKKNCSQLDILVNNAGIISDGYFLMMSKSTFNHVMDVNFGGVVSCTRNALRMMTSKKSGVIINIASTSGLGGQEGQANYSASKGAIIAFSKSIAKEYAKYGIRVNVVAPGFINTKMTESIKSSLLDKYGDLIPMRKFGDPEDVANATTFLASEKAKYITGKVLTVDGGMII